MRLLGLYTRPVDDLGFDRVLSDSVSYSCPIRIQGWSLYCDCDFLFLDDIQELFDLADPKYAAMVVKHDYKPKGRYKMDGRFQWSYPRKNWSSLILFNNEHPAHQSLDVNNMSPVELHRFTWIDDKDLGELPGCWNWLVGYDDDSWLHLHFIIPTVHGLKRLRIATTLTYGTNLMKSGVRLRFLDNHTCKEIAFTSPPRFVILNIRKINMSLSLLSVKV